MTSGEDGAVGATWKDTQSKLEAAFFEVVRKLPSTQSSTQPIPYCETIPGIARSLVVMRPIERSPPHDEVATAKATRGQLKTLERHAETLMSAVEALNRPALDALGYPKPSPNGIGGLETQLRILAVKAKYAEVIEPTPDPRVSRKAKLKIRVLTLILSNHYYGLTGKKPTIIVRDGKACGPFLDLIETVFDALNVKASPESQARIAIKFMEKTPPSKWPITPLEGSAKT